MKDLLAVCFKWWNVLTQNVSNLSLFSPPAIWHIFVNHPFMLLYVSGIKITYWELLARFLVQCKFH